MLNKLTSLGHAQMSVYTTRSCLTISGSSLMTRVLPPHLQIPDLSIGDASTMGIGCFLANGTDNPWSSNVWLAQRFSRGIELPQLARITRLNCYNVLKLIDKPRLWGSVSSSHVDSLIRRATSSSAGMATCRSPNKAHLSTSNLWSCMVVLASRIVSRLDLDQNSVPVWLEGPCKGSKLDQFVYYRDQTQNYIVHQKDTHTSQSIIIVSYCNYNIHKMMKVLL